MTKIQHRRDNATNWASVNPVLGQGELAYNTTDGSFRIGDGTNHWSALAEYQYGAIHYMGVWNASGGSYPSDPEQGQYYVISVAGTISGTAYVADDWIVYNGLAWNKVNNQVYQPLDSTLTTLSNLTTAADKMIYFTASDTATTGTITSLGRSLIGETTESAIRDLISAASSTTGTQNIYVDKSATGAGTGVDWTNAFTTIRAAVNSLPAIISHAVTIYIRKGTTAYSEDISVNRVVSGGSITLRGEYYWVGTNNGTQTGILDLNPADPGYANRAQIAAGDVVWAIKWSGTVNASTPSESIIDTVASVSGAEVTLTTNSAKEFDTTWTYRIVKTALTSSSSTLPTIYIRNTDAVTVSGLDITGGTYGVWVSNSRNVSLSYIRTVVASGTSPQSIRIDGLSDTTITGTLVESSVSTAMGVHATKASYFVISTSIVNWTGGAGSSGIRLGYASASLVLYSHVLSAGTGLYALHTSFIGAINVLNAGTTAKNPATNPGADGGYIT